MSTNTTSEYIYTEDDFKAGLYITVLVSIGFILICTVIVGCFRIPAMNGSFGRLTANQNISQLIACCSVLVFFSCGVMLDTRAVIVKSHYFGSCSILILTVITLNFLLISFNRFCAICFPIEYKHIFRKKTLIYFITICWLLPIAATSYFIFFLKCELVYVQHGWFFTSDTTVQTCGTSLRTYVIYSQNVLSTMITITDILTIIMLVRNRHDFSQMSKESRKVEISFAKQTLIQGLIFNLHMVWYSNAYQWLPGTNIEWKLFFSTSFSSNFLMIFDPLIVLGFNNEFRNWILNGTNRKIRPPTLSVSHSKAVTRGATNSVFVAS